MEDGPQDIAVNGEDKLAKRMAARLEPVHVGELQDTLRRTTEIARNEIDAPQADPAYNMTEQEKKMAALGLDVLGTIAIALSGRGEPPLSYENFKKHVVGPALEQGVRNGVASGILPDPMKGQGYEVLGEFTGMISESVDIAFDTVVEYMHYMR